MPRSSRSHKSRQTMPSSSARGARNRQESEEEFEEESRKRKPAVKERAASGYGVRVSKPSPKGQSALQDDVEKSPATDRWNGGDKSESFGPLEAEKAPKSSILVGVAEKRRPEKALRRESQNRDGKVEDPRRERSDDATSRKQGIEKGRHEKEPGRKDSTEWQGQDVLRCPERQKELEKHSRRGGSSSKTVNCQEDGTNSDDKRLSSRDDRRKDPRYKDEMHKVERHKDERHRDKSREEHDRDVRRRDERSSREFSSSRSDSKRPRDEKKLSEGHSKKSKLQGNMDGNPCIKDSGNKSKDAIGQKSSICENDAHGDREHGNVKEPHKDAEEMLSNTNKAEFPHPDKFDSSLSNNRSKSFASSSFHTARDQCRSSSKQAESAYSVPGYEEGCHLNATSAGDGAGVSASHESVCEPQSSENKANDVINSEELLMEAAEAALQNDKISRSDGHVSPIQLAEKSPPTASDQRCSSRSGARYSVDMQDVEQEGCRSKDGKECYSVDDRLELPLKSASVDSHSQIDAQSSEIAPTASSSYNQEGSLSGNSPGHLPSPPPVKLGTDSSSVLDSCEVDRVRLGNRKSNRCYKRNSDIIVERGRGNSWTGSHTWPSPVPSGFIPFPNGPPPLGFHSTIHQFPASSPFGMRPSMDMNHMGVPYHTHGMDDHFSSHDRSFGGWHNVADDSFPRMQGWDGGNNAHVYRGPDWDRNGHLMGSLGWGMNPSVWNRQSGSIDIEFSIPQDSEYSSRSVAGAAQIGQSSNQSCSERVHSDHATDESTEMKQSSWSPAKNVVETPRRTIPEKASGHCEISNTNSPPFCPNYLSKLEISFDLTTSELYEQCMTLLASKDPLGVCGVYNQGNTNSQHSKKEFNLVVKGQKLKYLFPSITDAMFQRAMSLYKEQANMEGKIAVSTFGSEGICTREDPDIEKTESISSQISEGPSPAGADSAGNTKDVMDIITDAAG